MARDAIAVQSLGANGGSLAAVTFNAVTQANGSYIANDGTVLVLAKNAAGGGLSRTVTVTSVADEYGRTGTITRSVADGAIAAIGLFKPSLYNQTDTGNLGKLYLDYDSDSGLTIAAISVRQ